MSDIDEARRRWITEKPSFDLFASLIANRVKRLSTRKVFGVRRPVELKRFIALSKNYSSENIYTILFLIKREPDVWFDTAQIWKRPCP